MKVSKIIPIPYAKVESDGYIYHVYADGRVFYINWDGESEPYADWDADYEEIQAVGLEVLK